MTEETSSNTESSTMEREPAAHPETSLSDVPGPPKPSAHPMYPEKPRENFSPKYITPETDAGAQKEEFFAFRPSLISQAIQDVRSQLSPDEDGNLQSTWILTQISHWGAECELLGFLCEQSLILCYYDFVGLCSSRLFRVPLHFIDTVTWGPLCYPPTALNKLDGHALKVQWDKLRDPPSFISRWNPWAQNLPYVILTKHPGAPGHQHLRDMCQLEPFMERLVESVKSAHRQRPLPGRANGLLVLYRSVTVETSVGLLAFLSSKAQLGYAKPRGIFGF
ncbi:tumor protein p63-regulated gene 1-like protein [Spea bombifrons]|uniref:tumor protein p63-regulated gene 1-like protein n=1 Tax=Spea bombifrons TaxID=233779 RepID=UPI00234A6063|nr:tumor protein p63-regulated gene 1-like protein [Spea bombifrons]